MALKMMNISKTIREQIPIIYCTLSLLILLLLLFMVEVDGFLPKSQYYFNDYYRQHVPPLAFKNIHEERIATTIVSLASRYGPPTDDLLKDLSNQRDDDDDDDDNAQDRHQRNNQEQKIEFRQLLDRVLHASAAEHIPSLLTKHTELLLRMTGVVVTETIQEILEEYREKGDTSEVERVSETIEMILSFTEDFVNQSKAMDDNNKRLLGRIIRTMTESRSSSSSSNNKSQDDVPLSESNREEMLDQLIASEKNNFTRGFLRYLDGECDRIASAPTISKESTRLRETLLVIKARILEELGQDLGEGALVLGQLVAYDDRNERLAVLDAGLQVRGIDFAQELMGLTEEALVGFQAVPNGDVDPTLVSRVEEIDERVRAYVKDNSAFQ